MKTYIGDRNEVIVGRANGIAPDGTAVMVIARTSTTYGNGVLVMRAADGLNWTSEFLPTTAAMAGCAYDAANNTIYVINSALTGNSLTIQKSTDFGVNWTTSTSSLAGLNTTWTAFAQVVFDAPRNRIILSTGTRSGLAVGQPVVIGSYDGGETWETVYANPIDSGWFFGVCYSPMSPTPIFIRGSSTAGSSVYKIYKSNLTDDTLEEMEDVINTTLPVTGGYSIAYSPISKTYVSANSTTSATSISFSLEPNGPPRQTTVISGNLNSWIAYITWNDKEKLFFATCRADNTSTDPTLYRTYKSVYGNGGWLYDPSPIYNTQNRFGVSMFYDELRQLTQIYSHGYTAAQRIQLGYLGAAGTLPTPTPTPTTSPTPSPVPIPLNNDILWIINPNANDSAYSAIVKAYSINSPESFLQVSPTYVPSTYTATNAQLVPFPDGIHYLFANNNVNAWTTVWKRTSPPGQPLTFEVLQSNIPAGAGQYPLARQAITNDGVFAVTEISGSTTNHLNLTVHRFDGSTFLSPPKSLSITNGYRGMGIYPYQNDKVIVVSNSVTNVIVRLVQIDTDGTPTVIGTPLTTTVFAALRNGDGNASDNGIFVTAWNSGTTTGNQAPFVGAIQPDNSFVRITLPLTGLPANTAFVRSAISKDGRFIAYDTYVSDSSPRIRNHVIYRQIGTTLAYELVDTFSSPEIASTGMNCAFSSDGVNLLFNVNNTLTNSHKMYKYNSVTDSYDPIDAPVFDTSTFGGQIVWPVGSPIPPISMTPTPSTTPSATPTSTPTPTPTSTPVASPVYESLSFNQSPVNGETI